MIALLLATMLLDTEVKFSTPDHEVTMAVQFPAAYQGKPLAFYSAEEPTKRRCYTQLCIDRFVGAAAVVNFTVTKVHRKAPKPSRIRELVTIIEQSPDMPPAPPFDLTQNVVDGKLGDLQVMGYDEDGIPEAERARMREESKTRMWRRVRQELFLNGAATPFAVIEWKHMINGIELVRADGAVMTAKK